MVNLSKKNNSFLLRFTAFYSVLPHLVLSTTKYPPDNTPSPGSTYQAQNGIVLHNPNTHFSGLSPSQRSRAAPALGQIWCPAQIDIYLGSLWGNFVKAPSLGEKSSCEPLARAAL